MAEPGCVGCGCTVPASLGTKPRKWCSESCRVRAWEARTNKVRVTKCAVSFPSCLMCGVIFAARAGGRIKRTTCSQGCFRAWRNEIERDRYANQTSVESQVRLARKARRRAIIYGVEAERFTHREVFERDGWMCGLCHDPVDSDLRHPDPMCASLDHVVPLALGGHHVLSNVQCAHLVCNIRKGARAVA